MHLKGIAKLGVVAAVMGMLFACGEDGGSDDSTQYTETTVGTLDSLKSTQDSADFYVRIEGVVHFEYTNKCLSGAYYLRDTIGGTASILLEGFQPSLSDFPADTSKWVGARIDATWRPGETFSNTFTCSNQRKLRVLDFDKL